MREVRHCYLQLTNKEINAHESEVTCPDQSQVQSER